MLARSEVRSLGQQLKRLDDVLKAFDPSEARDPHGRWTITGGRAGAAAFAIRLFRARRAARRAREAAQGIVRRKPSYLFKYSPDQPRDRAGKWTSTGGGAHGPSSEALRARY